MLQQLWLGGCAAAIKVDVRRNFLRRLRGLLGCRRLADNSCVWLEPCAVVHTLGMRFPLDLAFVSASGIVLHVAPNVPAGRIRWFRGAHAVVEANAGAMRRWGLATGKQLEVRPRAADAVNAADAANAKRVRASQTGSATLEFVAAAVLVLLPLIGAIFEGVQLAITRQLLTVAAVEAARLGAVTHGDRSGMQRRLARGLVPLFGAPMPGGSAGETLGAYTRAWIEVQRPDLTRFSIDRPSAASFADFAVEAAGSREIPNDGDSLLPRRGAASGLTLAQSNILAIRIRYCRLLIVPGLSDAITALLSRAQRSPEPFDLVCLAQGRVPIEVCAAVHMQSPARAVALGISG